MQPEPQRASPELGTDLLASLPHRPPFVFIDEVVARSSGESAHGIKTFRSDDPLFEGHFPGDPIVPGVLLTEALAQVAGLAASGSCSSPSPGTGYLLSAIRQMKFPSAARPGDRIDLSVEKSGELGALLIFDATASVAGRVVAEGRIVLNRREDL